MIELLNANKGKMLWLRLFINTMMFVILLALIFTFCWAMDAHRIGCAIVFGIGFVLQIVNTCYWFY